MTKTQREAYSGETEIRSIIGGLFSRDNRNHRKKQELIVEYTAATKGDSILEVGCGDGIHAREYVNQFSYTGVDLSPSLVQSTRSKINGQGCALEMDARDLSFGDDYFDAVVGTAILHHLPDHCEALEEWIRVTKSGGTVTLAEPNYLFPKDFVTAHFVPEEQHKTEMAPWRVKKTLASLTTVSFNDWVVLPFNYTPPYPVCLESVYDRLDRITQQIPAVRWLSQMLLINIHI